MFSRTQYDVLRRLRSYWLPRFVIHKDADPTFQQRLVSGTVNLYSNYTTTFAYRRMKKLCNIIINTTILKSLKEIFRTFFCFVSLL